MKLYNVFTTSFYGSNLYSLFSNECNRLYSSWNIAIRDCFNVHRQTHRYLIEDISDSMHPMVFLSSRFVKFDKSLATCSKPAIRLLGNIKRNDCRTVLGDNLSKIAKKCEIVNINELSSAIVKSTMKYFPTPECETWRSEVVNDMLSIKAESYFIDNFDHSDINDILYTACTS